MEEYQEHFSRALKWVYNPEGRGPDAFRMLGIANPLLMFPMVVLLGGVGEHFWRHYLYSLAVAEGVSLTCLASREVIAIVGFRLLKIKVERRTFVLASLATMVPGLWVGFWIADRMVAYLGDKPPPHTSADYGSGLTIGSLIFGIISILDLWFVAKKKSAQLERETLQAKLSALSAQMNPHLLFNALNTIASTIPSDPKAAEETTLKLSELYRGILSSSKRNFHAVSTEIEICKSYLTIESARFGDRLRWSIEIEPGIEQTEVPTLLIQPLVENAVKHGISQRGSGGHISVSVSRLGESLRILVEDDGIGFGNSRSKGTGTGVSSCKSRLELLYQGRATFDISQRPEGGTRVQMALPGKFEVPT